MRAGARSIVGLRVTEPVRWVSLLRVEDADLGRDWALRIQGEGIDYQVVLDGWCGPEVLANDTIAAGPDQVVRPALPALLAGTSLRLEVRLSAAGPAREPRAELGWEPMRGGPR